MLDAADCTFDDVVDVTTFHTDPEVQFDTVMAVRSKRFASAAPYPNWTAVGVNWLAGFDFEIKAVARVPDAGVAPDAPADGPSSDRGAPASRP